MDLLPLDFTIPSWSWGDSWLDLLWVILAILSLFPMMQLRGGASRVFFDIVGTFQADRLLQDAGAKQAAFNAIMLDGIGGIQEAFQLVGENIQQFVDSWKQATIEIADARIEFEKFVVEGANVAKLTRDITEMGEQYGFAADQSLAAAARMAQLSGIVGVGAMSEATEVGIQFALIGGMETELAMTRLINLQQQTGFMYGELTRETYLSLEAEEQANVVRENSIAVLNQLNTVENRSAATLSQITYVMNQFASQADMAGDSIAEMAAISATLIESGEEQGKAGRALKMIYARLGADTNGAAQSLHAVGVATHDSTGNLRSLSDILADLNKQWPEMEDAQKQSIAQQVAGNNHYVRFLKLADNYDRTTDLVVQSLLDQDTAMEEVNRKLQEQVTALRAAEADLKNYRAELGDSLLPALTQATEMQARLTGALADFADAPGFQQVAKWAIMMQQYGRSFGGFIDFFINVKGLTVAMQTQHTIMRGMAGIELVHRDAYGQKVNSASMFTNQLSQMQTLTMGIMLIERLRNITLEDMNLKTGVSKAMAIESIAHAETKIRKLSQELGFRERIIAAEQAGEMSANQLLDTIRTRHNTMRALSAEEEAAFDRNIIHTSQLLAMYQQEISAIQRKYDMLDYREQKAYNAALTNIEVGSAKKRAAMNEDLAAHKEIVTAVDEVTGKYVHHGNKRNASQRKIRDLQAQIKLSIDEEEQAVMDLQAQYSLLDTRRIAGLTKEITATEQYLQKQGQYIFREYERAAAIAQSEGNTEAFNQALMLRSIAEEELTRIMALEAPLEERLAQLEALRLRLQPQLIKGMTDEALAAFMAEGGLRRLASGEANLINQTNQVIPKIDKRTMHMNNLSMTMGMASMAVGLFSDSEKAARMQVVLMIGSMGMMVIQASAATAAMMTQAAAQVAVAETAKQATFWSSALGTALKRLGVGLLITGAAWAITELLEFTGVLGDADDAVQDLNVSYVQLTKDIVDSANVIFGSENQDIRSTTVRINELTTEINELENAKASASDTGKALLQQDIDALAEERRGYEISRDMFMYENITGQGGSGLGLTEAQKSDVANWVKYADDYVYLVDGPLGEGWYHKPGVQSNWTEDQWKIAEDGPFSTMKDTAYLSGSEKRLNDPLWFQQAGMPMFMTYMRELGYEVPEAFITYMEAVGDAIVSADDELVDFTSHLKETQDVMYEFQNEREEMFFGFQAENLTGDLMKQVINEGVENLINQTEVIMTNHFTGLMADEMAEIIIHRIQELGSAQNMSMS
jgi:TP901 family phage tail tape measure protein